MGKKITSWDKQKMKYYYMKSKNQNSRIYFIFLIIIDLTLFISGFASIIVLPFFGFIFYTILAIAFCAILHCLYDTYQNSEIIKQLLIDEVLYYYHDEE